MNSNDTFKLHYFNINGRAALARAIFSAAKVPFENHLIEQKDWPAIKQSELCEFKQVPVLEHNGKKYSQSAAIYRYLGKLFKLFGNNLEEEYQIDSLLCTIEDMTPVMIPIIFPNEEQKKHKEENVKAFKEKLEFYMKVMEKRYIALGKGKYFLGDHFSLADIFIAVQLVGFQQVLQEDLMKTVAPGLHAIFERVKANELKEFYEKYVLAH